MNAGPWERENTSMAAAWCSSSEQAAVLQNNSTTQRSSHNSLLSPPPFPSKNIFSSSYMHHDPVRLSRMWTQSDSGSLVASRLLEIDPWIPLLLCSHAQFSCSKSSREQLERRSDDCYNSQSDDNREKQVESSPVGSSSSVCRCGVFMAVNGALDVSPNIFSSLRREQYDCKTRDNSSAPWRGTVLHCRLHAAFCRLTSIGPLTWKPWWSGSQGLHLLILTPKTHMKHLELDCCSGSSLTKLYFLNRGADSGSVRWFSTKYFFAFVMRIFKNWPVTWVGSVPGLEFSPLKIGTGPCLTCLTGVGEVKKIKNTSD